MKKIIFCLLVTALLNSCNSSTSNSAGEKENVLTDKEKNDGWKLLFDGNSFDGWHSYGKTEIGPLWSVRDGSLYLDADKKKATKFKGDDYLLTNDDYDNFDLKIDWKISKNGNSGIILYVKEDSSKYDVPYKTGPEYQVLDNNGHPDAKIIKHRAGDLYDLITSKETVKPVEEWNSTEIVSNNSKLDFYLNGEHTLNTTLWDDNWKKMVAGSKFKDMPDFGTFKSGKISLQDHGNNVWFRNIKIKKL